ncbi:hypothetical protein [Silicimonas sp. MF1-12-2]|uniref:hypothetical protein n=1 Tax=Silicimonas sp. MF1-12-2 TaxID=3384793 RepID=UPI0039B44379
MTMASETIFEAPATRQRLAIVFLSTYVVMLMAAGGGQIVDPFVHYDDYPALVLYPEGYYMKTLAEGRWLNYWWHLRGVFTPPWFNFQLYVIGWALFSAAASLSIFRTSDIRYPGLLAALLVLAPQTTLISGWFNTLIPGVWLMAAYAATTLFVSARTGSLLLLVFVPLALQTYSSYPFMLLAICMMREDQEKSLTTLVGLMALFTLSFGLGILVIYSLNFAVHEIFGVALAGWRDPEPASDLTGLIHNLSKTVASLTQLYSMTGFGKPALSAMIATAFLASLVAICRKRPIEVLFILVPAIAGLGLLCLHSAAEGIIFPFRSTYFVWLTVAISVVRAVQLREPGNGSAPFALTLMFTLTVGAMVRVHNQGLSIWQHETRLIAAQIPATAREIFIHGTHLAINGPSGPLTQSPGDFQYRVTYLTSIWAEMCTEDPESCEGVTPPFEPPVSGDPLLILQNDESVFIRLPITEIES